MFLKSKRGNAVIDTILFLLVMVVFGMVVLIGYQFFGDINTDIQANNDLTNSSKDISADLYDRYPSFFDGLFLFLLILLWGFVIVASFMIDSHPIFFIFAVVLLVFVLFIGGALSNFWDDLATDDDFAGLSANFPITNWILDNLIVVVAVIGLSVIIALYGKSRMG
ncbi:hypothetical protein GF386_05310 [Candidatus Pacearchaeota archaeon]|nr:hypothetical protein [Candidatus Pacearchaeota archaeon]